MYVRYVLQAKYFLLNLPAIHCDACTWQTKWIWCDVNKTEANLASTRVSAARCVRVIHAQCVLQFALLSRTLLRSSSNNEPSDPPYRIIFYFSLFIDSIHIQWQTTVICWMWKSWNDKSHTHHQNTHSENRVHVSSAWWLVIYIMVRHNHLTPNDFVMRMTVRSEEVVLVNDCVCAIKNER